MAGKLTMTKVLKIKKLRPDAKIPMRKHSTDSGMDLHTLDGAVIPPHHTVMLSTGIAIELPENCEGQIRSRSGLSSAQGLMVINGPGTVDRGYTGELKVALHNASPYTRTVVAGDRVAQLVIAPVVFPEISVVTQLEDSDRGNGGFGSTGVQ